MDKKGKTKDLKFDLYRYQILPRDRHFQGNLFDNIKSVEDLIEKKNSIFYSAIKNLNQLHDSSGPALIFKLIHDSNNFLIFRVAVGKSVTIEKPNFEEEEVDNWPSFLIGIWNDPNKQLIFVQERKEAYSNTNAVKTIIEKKVSTLLQSKQLNIFIQPLFKKEKFWEIAKANEGKVQKITFELITPNMANISKGLSKDLESLATATNTNKTTMSISSGSGDSLKIDKSNNILTGLVDYSSNGGGDISLKITGYTQTLHTNGTKKRITVSDIEVKSNNPEYITKIVKDLKLLGNEEDENS